jgi:hypothetical protein
VHTGLGPSGNTGTLRTPSVSLYAEEHHAGGTALPLSDPWRSYPEAREQCPGVAELSRVVPNMEGMTQSFVWPLLSEIVCEIQRLWRDPSIYGQLGQSA